MSNESEISRCVGAASLFGYAQFIRKMQDPTCQRITLKGIAYESGFNSKSTCNRTFKQLTNQSPLEYQKNLQMSAQFIT